MGDSKLQFSESRDKNDLSSGPEIHSATFMEEVDSLRLTLRGRKLTIAIAFVTGAGFTLFGCEDFHVQKS
jgi:hypothetical protein